MDKYINMDKIYIFYGYIFYGYIKNISWFIPT